MKELTQADYEELYEKQQAALKMRRLHLMIAEGVRATFHNPTPFARLMVTTSHGAIAVATHGVNNDQDA